MKTYRSPKIEVRDDTLAGRGVVAIADIAKDEIVAIKAGMSCTRDELDAVTAAPGDMALQIDDDFYIAPRRSDEVLDMSVMINHSCDPNVGFRGNVIYVAMRDIAAGEELSHDYAMERSDDYSLDCRCGSALCRGKVTGEDWKLPAAAAALRRIFFSLYAPKIRGERDMSATADQLTAESILLRDDRDGITTLTLNRPAQYNALSSTMLDALQARSTTSIDDESVRVVIIAANGKAFCPGHDLKEMRSSEDREFHQALFDKCSRMMLTINRLRQPVIAQVNGIATAAGCQLVATCDLAVAADDARFAVSGINVGLFCSTPAVPCRATCTASGRCRCC